MVFAVVYTCINYNDVDHICAEVVGVFRSISDAVKERVQFIESREIVYDDDGTDINSQSDFDLVKTTQGSSTIHRFQIFETDVQ